MSRQLKLTRELVSKLPATITDPGPIADIAHLQTDEAIAERMAAALAARPAGDVWVFAFGSLIWNPGVPVAERRNARMKGWQRSFCLGPDTRYRGNPDNPGLMLSLEQGGQCDGVALRLPNEDLDSILLLLFTREPPIPPVWRKAQTEGGPISVLAFVAPEEGFGYVGELSLDEIATQITHAVGMFGNMPDYVLNTVEQLEAAKLHDPMMWELQALLAQRLEALP